MAGANIKRAPPEQFATQFLAKLRAVLASDEARLDTLAAVVEDDVAQALARARQRPLTADRAAWLRGMVGKTLSHDDAVFRYVLDANAKQNLWYGVSLRLYLDFGSVDPTQQDAPQACARGAAHRAAPGRV